MRAPVRRVAIRTQVVDSPLTQQFRALVGPLPVEFNGPVTEMYRHVLTTAHVPTHVWAVEYAAPTDTAQVPVLFDFERAVESVKSRPKPKPRAQVIF